MDREHPGQPQRPPAYAHLLIDSKDRDPNADRPPYEPTTEPANDFTIYRNQALLYGYFTRLAITQVQLNWRMATIIPDVNDTIVMTCDTAPLNNAIILDPGFYTPDTLATELQNKIQAEGGALATFTVIWWPETSGFLIESNSAAQFYFPTPNTFFAATGNLTQSKAYSRACRTLGILNNDDLDVEQYLSPPQLLWTRYIDICSRRLTKFQRVKDIDTAGTDTKSFIIARVYLCPPGQRTTIDELSAPGDSPFDLVVDYNTPKQINWSPQEAVNELDLQVYDEFGELLPWDGAFANWEYQLTLVASET